MRKLRKRLGTAGCLGFIYLILWVANNRPDGNLKGLSDEDIELAAEWDGEAGSLVRALLEVGFLEGNPGALVVHDWVEHNPWAANRPARVAASKAAAEARWKGKNAERMQGACGSHESAMPSSPLLSSPPKNIPAKAAAFEDRLAPTACASKAARLSGSRLSVLAGTIYEQYPRKVGKGDALKAFAKAIRLIATRGESERHPDFLGDCEAAAGWLKGRVIAYCESPQGQQADKTYIPHPATWANKGRYDDDPAEWSFRQSSHHGNNGEVKPVSALEQIRKSLGVPDGSEGLLQ